jgi:DNA (cytosine-5)-methyltransferase 1
VDAVHFVPQSRPRLFVVGIRNDLDLPAGLISKAPSGPWYPEALLDAIEGLPKQTKAAALWLRLPMPAARRKNFVDIIETIPKGVRWHTPEETDYLLGLMSPLNLAKVKEACKAKTRKIGGAYRRTRNGKQRAEVRFDDIAGCLRTPSGGSSRQTIFVIENGRIRSRLLSPREAARLMGLPDKYRLPENYNETYHLVGDGVAVPVVRHIARNLLEPILEFNEVIEMAAA